MAATAEDTMAHPIIALHHQDTITTDVIITMVAIHTIMIAQLTTMKIVIGATTIVILQTNN